MTLNFIGQIYGNLGIPNHTRAFIRALEKAGVDVRPIPTHGKIAGGGKMADYDLTPDITSKLGKIDNNAPAICFWYPPTFDEVLGVFPKNIGYFIFEYTVIPKEWIEIMNNLDVVCTASQWGVDVLKANGLTTKAVVVPGGVDTKIYYPRQEELSVERPYRFIHVGKAETRKSSLEILQAFNKAFKGDRSAELIFMADNGKTTSENFVSFWEKEGLFKYSTDNIYPISYVDDIARMYRESDCGVFPSKSEGIGLPITEAMACGLPVITSKYSGMTEYVTDENAIVLKNGTMTKIYDPQYFPVAGQMGVWLSPNIDEIADKMLWAFNNKYEAKKIGAIAAADMKSFSWERAAKKFKQEVLDENQ